MFMKTLKRMHPPTASNTFHMSEGDRPQAGRFEDPLLPTEPPSTGANLGRLTPERS